MEREINYKYIVYCTTNLVNNMIYVGIHKTLDPTKFDGYIGNGIFITLPYTYKYSKTKFQQAVNEYGVKNFKRQVLAVFDTEDAAYDLEADIVNEEFLKRNDVYNMILGGEYYTPNKIKAFQYDLEGNFIREYESIMEASIILKVHHTAIGHAIRRKQKACNSYWTTDKVNKLDLNLYNKGTNHRIPVHIYSLNGEFIRTYSSYSEAAKELNSPLSSIRAAALLGYCINKLYYATIIYATTYDKARNLLTNNREVYKYDSNGRYLESYKTQREAERKNPGSNITKFIKNKKVDKNGFMWALIKVPNYNEPIGKSTTKKTVGKYDLDGNLIQIYESATRAANENGTSVWKVLAGTNKTHKNHIYKYIDN